MLKAIPAPEAARRRAGRELALHLDNAARLLGYQSWTDRAFLLRVSKETGIEQVTLRGLDHLAPQLRTIERLAEWIQKEARTRREAVREAVNH